MATQQFHVHLQVLCFLISFLSFISIGLVTSSADSQPVDYMHDIIKLVTMVGQIFLRGSKSLKSNRNKYKWR